ncbi:hydrogenase nickel incorporation protein HypB [Chitinibacter sp. S2-10]|uniref:hydrogenase nickel incorporation protein HypB n=1 Tax=Chitinibacter sp. S2-10 TaxID=3373597 RepID=UPI003977E316
MCTTCGCGGFNTHGHSIVGLRRPASKSSAKSITQSITQPLSQPVTQPVTQPAQPRKSAIIDVETAILAANNSEANALRQQFIAAKTLVLNLVSSPGSGKTSLLVATIAALKQQIPLAVIEGDQQTSLDAERIAASGAPAIQINTGKGCHLDARMIREALDKLPLPQQGLLLIENVGNLVCPAAFDLGEAAKVAVLSVTEGEDKPLKYPDMFQAARLMLLNKCDLLPHLDFDLAKAIDYARCVNPDIEIIQVSAKTGVGIDQWLAWIAREQQAINRQAAKPRYRTIPTTA